MNSLANNINSVVKQFKDLNIITDQLYNVDQIMTMLNELDNRLSDQKSISNKSTVKEIANALALIAIRFGGNEKLYYKYSNDESNKQNDIVYSSSSFTELDRNDDYDDDIIENPDVQIVEIKNIGRYRIIDFIEQRRLISEALTAPQVKDEKTINEIIDNFNKLKRDFPAGTSTNIVLMSLNDLDTDMTDYINKHNKGQ